MSTPRPNRAQSVGYRMIHSIDIRNFRCFQRLQISDCSRLNVIVGDNGTGKTALLEAIFLPLCTSTQVSLRMRQQRGLDGNFSGSPKRIEEAMWGDFFYHYNYRQPIQLILKGEGQENRSLTISRGPAETLVPLADADQINATIRPLTFVWTDAFGHEHVATPTVTQAGMQFPDTGEDIPDFFMFASNQTVSSLENAQRFSELSRAGNQQRFIDLFRAEYPWLGDINIEVIGGSPALFARVASSGLRIPLANVSGGINRIVSVLLGIASRQRSVVLVDEIENGIYYKHQTAIWRGILSFLREYESQMFATTHSEEGLNALLDAADGNVSDIALWRMERGPHAPVLKQFGGETFKAGIEAGGDLR